MSEATPVSPARLRGLTRLLAARLSELEEMDRAELSLADIAEADLNVLSHVLVKRQPRNRPWSRPKLWLDRFLAIFADPEYLDGRHFRELERLLHLECATLQRLTLAENSSEMKRIEVHISALEARLIEALQVRLEIAAPCDIPRYILERSMVQLSVRSLMPDDARVRVLRWSKTALATMLRDEEVFAAVLNALGGSDQGWERRAYLCFFAEQWTEIQLEVCRDPDCEMRAERIERLLDLYGAITLVDGGRRDLNEVFVSLYVLRKINQQLSKEPENGRVNERLWVVERAREIAAPFLQDEAKVQEMLRLIEEDEGMSSQVA